MGGIALCQPPLSANMQMGVDGVDRGREGAYREKGGGPCENRTIFPFGVLFPLF